MLNRCKQTLPVLLVIMALALSSNPAQAKTPIRSAPAVTATTVEKTLVTQSLSALGTLKANQSVDIASRINGRIATLSIEDGLSVKKGDTLVTLDKREQKARVQEAKVTLSDEIRQLNYMDTLYQRQAISKDQLEVQQATVDKAKAVLSGEETALSYHTLKAPFSGVLGFSDLSTGALVTASQVMTTLDDLSVMKLYFELPENTLSRIKPGTTMTATTDAWPGERFRGSIDTINPRINPDNLTFTARAVLANESTKLRPGMMVRIDVNQSARPTLAVPARSVMFDGNNKYVFVIDDNNIARKQFITTGTILEESIAVSKGLQAGDRVVDEGVVKVRDGSPVKIVDSELADSAEQKGETHS